MEKKLFILTNRKQILGAKLSEYSFRRHLKNTPDVAVEILVVDDLEQFRELEGRTYLRCGKPVAYALNDLQSFTLARFIPPERMGFDGRAVAIDPDIFALQDVSKLFNLDLKGNRLAAVWKPEKRIWDTSVMIFDCEKLSHWRFNEFIRKLFTKEIDYTDLMHLKIEQDILKLDRIWNSLDHIDENTRILHTTNRITQPWRTGLPIDFTIKPMPKLLGFIPREPIHKLLGKYPTHYKKHPNKKVEETFFTILGDALHDGVVTREEITTEIKNGHVRKDIFQKLQALKGVA